MQENSRIHEKLNLMIYRFLFDVEDLYIHTNARPPWQSMHF